MRARSPRRPADYVLIATFLAVINLPLLAVLLDFDPEPLNRDRVPQMPETIGRVLSLPGSVQWFFNEGFGFRSAMIRAHATIWLDGFSASPSRRVIVGRDGWLFLREVLDDFRHIDVMRREDIAAWFDLIEARHAATAERDIPYLFMIAPDKATVYGSRFMPSWVARNVGTTRLDQLLNYIAQSESPITIVDPREAVTVASARERTFHVTDTHWNEWGAYAGYLELVEAIRACGFAIDPVALDDLKVKTIDAPGGDLARLIGLKERIREKVITITLPEDKRPLDEHDNPVRVVTIDVPPSLPMRTTCPQGEIHRGVIFHDSFGIALIPLLARHFQEAVFVRTASFEPAIVDAENPDIVIQQIVQRRLITYDPRNLDKSR